MVYFHLTRILSTNHIRDAKNRQIAHSGGGILQIGEHRDPGARWKQGYKGCGVQPEGPSMRSTRGATLGEIRKTLPRRGNRRKSPKSELMSRSEKELGVLGRRRGESLPSDLVRLSLVMQGVKTGTKRESWGGRLRTDPGSIPVPHWRFCRRKQRLNSW